MIRAAALALLFGLSVTPALAIVDHVCTAADEATAKALPEVARYVRLDETGTPQWDTSRVIPGVRVWRVTGQQTVTDPDTGAQSLQDVELTSPGFWFIVSPPTIDASLMASAACVLVANRDAALAGQPFMLKSNLAPADIPTYRLAPVPMGSNYPFGQ